MKTSKSKFHVNFSAFYVKEHLTTELCSIIYVVVNWTNSDFKDGIMVGCKISGIKYINMVSYQIFMYKW